MILLAKVIPVLIVFFIIQSGIKYNSREKAILILSILFIGVMHYTGVGYYIEDSHNYVSLHLVDTFALSVFVCVIMIINSRIK
jgi:hypothetical protein